MAGSATQKTGKIGIQNGAHHAVLLITLTSYLRADGRMSREMALNVFGVFISIVVVAFSVDGSTADSEAEYLYFYSPLNSDVIINPGSKEVLTVLLNYLDSDLQPVVNPVKKDVSVTFTLSDPREGRLCLSEKGDEGTKTTDCSSFSVTIQNTTESLSLVISYSPPVDEAFIEKDKVFHLDVSSNDLHNPTVKLQPITITTRDSRSKYLTLLNVVL